MGWFKERWDSTFIPVQSLWGKEPIVFLFQAKCDLLLFPKHELAEPSGPGRWARNNNVRPHRSDGLHAVLLWHCALSLPPGPPSADTALPMRWYLLLLGHKIAGTRDILVHMQKPAQAQRSAPTHSPLLPPQSFSVSRLALDRSEWCRAWRRLSLMETNVDT